MFNLTSNTKPRRPQAASPTAPAAQQPVPAAGAQPGAPAGTPPQAAQDTNPYIQQRLDEIEAQRTALAQKEPGFSMQTEMQNPVFVNYLFGKGLTVEEAYFLTHREELLDRAREEALEELSLRRERIPENGAAKNRPAMAKKNPKDLSDKEIDAIIERARNGEKITF